jgi:hypothetical protein
MAAFLLGLKTANRRHSALFMKQSTLVLTARDARND